MVKSASIVIVVMLGVSGVAPAAAEPMRLAQTLAADIVPPYEVFTIIRSMGMRPLGRPHYRGRFYVVHAVDPRGVDVRVVVDAHAARVVSVRPLDRQAAREYDGPSVYRRYDPGPPPVSGPRVIEAEPRYVPPRPVPSNPRYGAPRVAPDDDYFDERPDELDADDWNETGSLPSRDAPRIGAPKTSPATPLTRSAAVTPPKTPLPRPRPARPASEVASAPDKTQTSAVAAQTAQPNAAPDAKSDAAKPADANGESGKGETVKSEAATEAPKPAIRIIEIKKPEPRI
jgi:hypothetical protein